MYTNSSRSYLKMASGTPRRTNGTPWRTGGTPTAEYSPTVPQGRFSLTLLYYICMVDVGIFNCMVTKEGLAYSYQLTAY